MSLLKNNFWHIYVGFLNIFLWLWNEVIWCCSMLRLMVHQSNTTVFSITFDAGWSAKFFRIENIPSGQKTWNHWLWRKVICKRLTASFALSCAINLKQTMLVFSTTWFSSVWLTLLKHVSVVRNFLTCLCFLFFFFECTVII